MSANAAYHSQELAKWNDRVWRHLQPGHHLQVCAYRRPLEKTVLYNFPDWHLGTLPNSTLVFDNARNLYGVAGGGNTGCGPYTCGVVYRLARSPNGCWKYEVIHKFSGPDGNFPIGIAVDERGHLFGTTEAGGAYNSGVAFEIKR